MPVRVALVLYRTWVNGWCTARRFQVKEADCLLGCKPTWAERCYDSIEHYAHCPIIRQFSRESLDLPEDATGNMLVFLCLQGGHGPETLCVQQLVLYAVYTATNALRRTTGFTGQWKELLLQYVHQGAGQSAFAQQALRAHLESARRKRRRLE